MLPERGVHPLLVLRKTRENRYTLAALLGCLEGEGLNRDFHILIASSLEELTEKVAVGKAIVGFSFMTPHLLQVKEELEKLRKALSKDAIFVAGGSHATGDPEGTLGLGFDFVFAGESERTFPAFLRRFLSGKLPDTKIFRGDKNSSIFASCPPHSLAEHFFSPVEITRGCLYHCAFCQTPRIFGHSPRHRSAAGVAMHLRRTIPYGYRQSAFISPNAFSYGSKGRQGPNTEAIEALLAACSEAGVTGVHFGCFPSEVRPDWVNPEVLQLVKKYCRNKTIVLGAQSGSDSLLAELNRGHSAEQALSASRWIRQAGFMPHVDFVFGFPGETMQDRECSLHLMKKMIEEHGAKIHAHTYLPLPGTPLFQKDPSRLDDETKNALESWERKNKLDGWWKEQEIMAWKIVEWRDQGVIQAESSREFRIDF
ncbi:MAG: TIGR04013 family B12-binding domain/radical SAM domain-containing protein [Deltaproteobacteria bacterium]|nr:TIGR04013 family B12-binding domain/radical SAM domain-containing protein [Deltaproteobacteria bacterium]